MADRIQGARKSLSTISRGSVLETIVLSLIVIIAVAVRIMPIRWGWYLNEFDPYLQWRMAQYVVDHGFLAWFRWHDTMSWYPYGADMPTWNLYGEAFVVAAITMALHTLGVQASVFDVAMIFPVVAGTLTVLAAYVLGKDIWGRGVGMFTALFLALNPSSIGRTQLGFLRHEPLGILLMILIFIFFRRATTSNTSPRKAMAYAALTGFCLFYLSASWAAAFFPLDLIVLYIIILALIGRSSKRIFVSYSIAMGIFLLFTPFLVPKLGFSTLQDLTWLAVPVGEVFLLCREVTGYISSRKMQIYLLAGVVLATVGVTFLLSYLHIIADPYGKFYAVINPFVRGNVPIIASVAEHQPATWSSFFYEFGTILLLGMFGFVFILQRAKNEDIFLLLWGITSVYFAASFVRLTLLLAPAFCILAAIGTVELGKPAVDIIREAVIFPTRKTRVVARIGREFGVAIFLILLIIMVPSFYRSVQASYQPATIVTSSIPTAPTVGNELHYDDWLQALAWMRQNTPPSAVVFAWWDYGYWITALGDRRTLADNGTQNSTQIAMIAQTFLDNATFAVPNLKRYNVTYVAIFITPGGQSQSGTGQSYQGFGEDGKWYWMARIGNNTNSADNNYKVVYVEQPSSAQAQQAGQSPPYIRELVNVTSGAVMANETITGSNNVPNDVTMLGYMMDKATLQLQTANPFDPYVKEVFHSSNNFVFLFQVAYPSPVRLLVGQTKSTIALGQQLFFTGNLTDNTGAPLTVTPTIALESLSGGQWSPITTIPVSSDGSFNYTWTPNAPGAYVVRVHYLGVPGLYFEAFTGGQSIQVQNLPATNLTLTSSSATANAGQPISLTFKMNPFVNGANVTLAYSTNNSTWTPIKSIVMTSSSMNFVWTVVPTGAFEVLATWSGDQSHSGSSALIAINKPP
ncbi:MAG TPA: STT3 domain-containing protein [Candidatus Bathyarchaeia archaeon]|nr:STT3 domain-containing protein [Candidatus Bathyarchaeia archaeon]